MGRIYKAIGVLKKGHVVKVSLADVLMEANESDQETCREVVRLSEGIPNESSIHTTLLLYRAKALRTTLSGFAVAS